MGNLFDTCLSFGGINAFSTVANACELNKRVVYARDGRGRIVGRKLIGITKARTLVGYHTYSVLSDEKGNAALRAVMRHYLTHVAARCHVPMADDGTVPTLFVQSWYDDGTVPWDADGAAADNQLTLSHRPHQIPVSQTDRPTKNEEYHEDVGS